MKKNELSALDIIKKILNRGTKLPPSHPNWNPGWPDYCDDDRFCDLALWAFSEAQLAIDNKISPEEQKGVVARLERECLDVKKIVLGSMQDYAHIKVELRLDYQKDFQQYCKRLVDFVEDSMRKGYLDHYECDKIMHEHIDFLSQDILMQSNANELLRDAEKRPAVKAGQGNIKIRGNKAGDTQRTDGLTGEALALAMLVKHPDWPDTRIAKAVGVNRTTLYDWPNFKKAKEALKQGKNKYPKGSKNGETGYIEAWDADT